MKHVYRITGINNEQDVHLIRAALKDVDGIESVEITQHPPQAVITMHHHVPDSVLNTRLSEAGNYLLQMAQHEKHITHEAHAPQHGSDIGGAGEHHDHAERSPHIQDRKSGGGHGHMGHDMRAGGHDHHRMMIEDFRKRFWISIVLTIPVMLLSEMIQHWLGIHFGFPGDIYVLLALSTVIFLYGGWPFLTGLISEVRRRSPGMMTLIGLAILVAYIFSVAVVLGFPGMDFFWELATLIDIMLLGHWLEMKSVLGASQALQSLVKMMPSEAHLVHGDHIMDVPLEDLKAGDILLVRPGEKIPADGIVTDGESYVNESMMTGESKPVKKEMSDEIIGGTLNGNGSLKVKVRHTGKDSYLSKVIALVDEAQKTKSRTQHLADRAARWLTYTALLVGVVTLVIWLMLGSETNYAIERMVTVMVISCPHALGLAIPLVVAISTAISAQKGLLVRNRTAFENSRKITAIVFDKTGTLTKGAFGVTRIDPVAPLDEKALLQLAASMEQSSEHPIATGIVHAAKGRNIELRPVHQFQAITGKGVQASIDNKVIKVVSPGYLREKNISMPDQASTQSETVVYVLIDEKLAGTIALSDEIRGESREAIKTLRDKGIKVMMATGDNQKVAKAVSDELSLNGFYAEVLPHDKVAIIKELQAKGEFVAMTGDGVNDAPALAQADVGIAVGSGTDVAAETADIILVNSNPKDIANLILFGRATYNKMIQNLAWATGYNVFAIPLAAGVLSPFGFVLSPAVGAVLMSLSTIIVAINAQLLRRSMA